MSRPRYSSPDGVDWRDPDMPCLCYMQDDATGEISAEYRDPKEVTVEAKNDIKQVGNYRYRLDPSYWWAKETEFRKQEKQLAYLPEGEFCDDCKSPTACLYAGCKEPVPYR